MRQFLQFSKCRWTSRATLGTSLPSKNSQISRIVSLQVIFNTDGWGIVVNHTRYVASDVPGPGRMHYLANHLTGRQMSLNRDLASAGGKNTVCGIFTC